MKINKYILALALLLVSLVCADETSFKWRQEKNTTFEAGEYLAYDVVWQFIPVGLGTLEVRNIEEVNARKAYHIVSTAKSAPFFDNFYKVRDQNESWMDVESLCSHKFKSDVSEGGYRDYTNVNLDQINNTFTIVESSKIGPTFLWVNDIISSMYFLRTRDLAVGKAIAIDTHTGDKSYPLVVNILRTEEVNTAFGKVKCFVIEPKIREGSGMFKAKGTLYIWITADDKKIPVLMRSKIAVGSVEARLREMKFGGQNVKKF